MSLHHTRSLLTKVSRHQCSGAPTCLHCEAAKALKEVKAVDDAAFQYVAAGGRVERLHPDALLTLRRIADETRTRG